MAEKKYRKRRRRGTAVYTPIAVLLIIIIVIFGISVFFRISAIEITGAEKYTIEQILSVSGIKKGDNLIFIDTNAASKNISSNLPYLNEVVIDKVIPDRLLIKVTESKPIAVFKSGDRWWIMDQKARVLEETDEISASQKIMVSGIEALSAVAGQQIRVNESDATKLKYLVDVLYAINNAGISDLVGSLDMSNIGNIKFTYTDRFTVILGSGENTDYKLSLMQNVIAQLTSDEKGRIDLSREGESHFVPL